MAVPSFPVSSSMRSTTYNNISFDNPSMASSLTPTFSVDRATIAPDDHSDTIVVADPLRGPAPPAVGAVIYLGASGERTRNGEHISDFSVIAPGPWRGSDDQAFRGVVKNVRCTGVAGKYVAATVVNGEATAINYWASKNLIPGDTVGLVLGHDRNGPQILAWHNEPLYEWGDPVVGVTGTTPLFRAEVCAYTPARSNYVMLSF